MKALSPTSRVVVPSTTLIQESDGEAVILSLASESYFGLDEMGTHFWKALTEQPSIESAFQFLSDQFKVEENELRNDLEQFIIQLRDRQLIELNDE